MTTRVLLPRSHRPGYAGLRLTADEYFTLPNDGNRDELIDGVTVLMPRPTTNHQYVSAEVVYQLTRHTKPNRLGIILFGTAADVARGMNGVDLVYYPDVLFVATARVPQIKDRIAFAPDVVVEVISSESRTFDTETKFADYERAGVREYWLIDPIEDRMTFYRLQDGRYIEASTDNDVQLGEVYVSEAVAGFRLILQPIRDAFRAL